MFSINDKLREDAKSQVAGATKDKSELKVQSVSLIHTASNCFLEFYTNANNKHLNGSHSSTTRELQYKYRSDLQEQLH